MSADYTYRLEYEYRGILNGPVVYKLQHVDVDWEFRAFPLTRTIPITPAPIVPVSNVTRVHHRAGEAFVLSGPNYPRVLLKGDWS